MASSWPCICRSSSWGRWSDRRTDERRAPQADSRMPGPDAGHDTPDRCPPQRAVGRRTERPRRRRALQRERHAFHRIEFSIGDGDCHVCRVASATMADRDLPNAPCMSADVCATAPYNSAMTGIFVDDSSTLTGILHGLLPRLRFILRTPDSAYAPHAYPVEQRAHPVQRLR